MHESNGVTIKEKPALNIDDWEIAFDGQLGFIGIVRDSRETPGETWLTMQPVFMYISNPNIQPKGNGLVNIGDNTRIVIPLEMMASDVPERLRVTRRRRVRDYDTADKRVFEALVRQALDNQTQLLAARSGLSLASEIPKGLPTPRGRLG